MKTIKEQIEFMKEWVYKNPDIYEVYEKAILNTLQKIEHNATGFNKDVKNEIRIQGQIAFLEDYLEDCFLQEHIDMVKSILSTIQEAKKRQGECKWNSYNHSGCGVTNNFFIDDVDFDYCPYCGKQIEFVRE